MAFIRNQTITALLRCSQLITFLLLSIIVQQPLNKLHYSVAPSLPPSLSLALPLPPPFLSLPSLHSPLTVSLASLLTLLN